MFIAANLGRRHVRGLNDHFGELKPLPPPPEPGCWEGRRGCPSVRRAMQAPKVWTEGSVKGGTWVSQPQGRRAEGPSPPCRSWSQLGWLLAWSDPESHTQAPQDSMWVTGAAGQPSASSCLTPVPSSPAGRVQLPLPPAFSSPFEQTKPQMVGELCTTSSCPCPP